MSKPELPTSDGRQNDREITDIADQLRSLKSALGSAYWESDEVKTLQQILRRHLAGYGTWGEEKLPMHQRARRAALLESECAYLLWPGRSDQ